MGAGSRRNAENKADSVVDARDMAEIITLLELPKNFAHVKDSRQTSCLRLNKLRARFVANRCFFYESIYQPVASTDP